MKRKLLTILLTLIIITGLLISATAPVFAVGTPPTKVNPPENFAASNYRGTSVYCTLSAPDDLRALIGQTEKERGYFMKILAQVDFKTDNGSWHYSPDWDNAATFTKYTLNFYNAITGGVQGKFLGHEQLTFKNMFPTETNVPVQAAFDSWDWYKSHSMTLRARFAIDFSHNNIVFSDWSKEYVLSNSSKMDYKKIMNENAPTILSSKIETRGVNKTPWVVLQLAQHPDAAQMFNAASSNSMWTEIWLRKAGDTDFKNAGSSVFAQENISLDVSAYFKDKLASYDAQAYEVKVRYKIDERAYQQAGVSAYNLLYSPYSNVLSYGMPAWSGASPWAASDLQKASDMKLIPDILKGADLTKPITRQEFCELALMLYEKATGKSPAPASPNPFIDTQNPKILKAYQLRITSGTSTTTFSPEKLIPREQVAAMLLSAIKAMVPDGDFSTAGAPVFSDQREISSWALESVKYVTKKGIIRGADGKFMPRATTTAQEAAGYGRTTREAAILMSLRTFDSLSSAAAPAQTAPASELVTGRNSSDDYERIKVGDTLDQVIGILGQGKKVSSETEDFYTWGNVGNGAYIEISFVDGHVKSEGCVGNYQADKYEKIKLEMSFNEVVSILGEGKKSKTDVNDYYEWKYSGGETIEIMVKGNIVIGKSKF